MLYGTNKITATLKQVEKVLRDIKNENISIKWQFFKDWKNINTLYIRFKKEKHEHHLKKIIFYNGRVLDPKKLKGKILERDEYLIWLKSNLIKKCLEISKGEQS